jgi:hypothetical protein
MAAPLTSAAGGWHRHLLALADLDPDVLREVRARSPMLVEAAALQK